MGLQHQNHEHVVIVYYKQPYLFYCIFQTFSIPILSNEEYHDENQVLKVSPTTSSVASRSTVVAL
jgi:hypothetical protein